VLRAPRAAIVVTYRVGVRRRARALIAYVDVRCLVLALRCHHGLVGVLILISVLAAARVRYHADLCITETPKHPKKYLLIVVFEYGVVRNVIASSYPYICFPPPCSDLLLYRVRAQSLALV
jgi:hypothetical protein